MAQNLHSSFIISKILDCIATEGVVPSPEGATGLQTELVRLAGDGSNRTFFRFFHESFACVVAMPADQRSHSLKEAESAFRIGRHLYGSGVKVPQVYGHDKESGMVLYEDLGSWHLYDQITESVDSEQRDLVIRECYRKVIDELLVMQVEGIKGFDTGWCWDTARYDKKLMLERESGYFLTQCWEKLLGRSAMDGIQKDFSRLSDIAADADGHFFLHRDFQSRNIMLVGGKVRIIDFQGGRTGPMGYDLAALLNDPYVLLTAAQKADLFAYYIKRAGEYCRGFDEEGFVTSYWALSIQRNLQIIGAFCYLSFTGGKTFFRPFIRPSLQLLHQQLHVDDTIELPILRETARQALDMLPDSL